MSCARIGRAFAGCFTPIAAGCHGGDIAGGQRCGCALCRGASVALGCWWGGCAGGIARAPAPVATPGGRRNLSAGFMGQLHCAVIGQVLSAGRGRSSAIVAVTMAVRFARLVSLVRDCRGYSGRMRETDVLGTGFGIRFHLGAFRCFCTMWYFGRLDICDPGHAIPCHCHCH